MRSWRYLLHIFILSYVISAIMWALPHEIPLKRRVDQLVMRPFRAIGLWQNWQMFGPVPPSQDNYVSAKITLANGRVVERNVSVMWKMSLAERYVKERWRKLFNDNLRLDEYKQYWPAVSRWFVREVSREESSAIAKVELWRHWRRTKPGMLVITDNDHGWSSEKFYTFPELPKSTSQVATPNTPSAMKNEVTQ